VALHSFHANERALLGIQTLANEVAFVEQLLESIHRVDYISVINNRDVSPARADPTSQLFDPIKGAIHHHRLGNLDEACWLVFLSVHFGRHRQDGWRLCADVYGGLGKKRWDWATIIAKPGTVRAWLAANQQNFSGRRFGNHRKYESLNAASPNGTAEAVSSYVTWVNPTRNHQGMIDDCRKSVGNDPKLMFDYLYRSMDAVARFGRTAKFDYLTMLGKLQLAPIEPGIPYMSGATGPLAGARLLLEGSRSAPLSWQSGDAITTRLGACLGVGMQVIEDALCNWQKSPNTFKPFRG
jgi:hypothetical protein